MRKTAIDENCVRGLARVLWAFLIVTLVIEALEYAEMLYRRIEGIEMVKHLIAGPISVGLGIQVVFSVIPLVILTVLLARNVRGRALIGWMSFSACPADERRACDALECRDRRPGTVQDRQGNHHLHAARLGPRRRCLGADAA